MSQLLLSIFLLFFQSDRIEFELSNASKDPIVIEIPGFRSLTLQENDVSIVRFRAGQELYVIEDVDGDDELDKLLLFEVQPAHAGQTVRVDKELKKVRKEFLKEN